MRDLDIRRVVKHQFREVSLVLGFVVKDGIQAFGIQCLDPFGDDQCRHAITNKVGQGTRFRHETVDTENQRQASYRHRTDGGQRGGQHNETAPGHTSSAFGGEQQDQQQGDLLRQIHWCIGRLGNKDCSHRQVDRGAIEIEGVTGRDDQTDDRFLGTGIFHLGHQAWQGRFRGGGAEHQEQFFLDVLDQFPDGETVECRDAAEYAKNEDQAGQVEGTHQADQLRQAAKAVLANGVGHRTESADWGYFHDDADDTEEDV